MSLATLETAVATPDGASDLASLVVAYHRQKHSGEPKDCDSMCRVADQCVTLDAMFYGTDA